MAAVTTRSRPRTHKLPFRTFAASSGHNPGNPSGRSSDRILPDRSRATEKVSHGGAAMMPMTRPSRTACTSPETNRPSCRGRAGCPIEALEAGRPQGFRHTSTPTKQVEEERTLHVRGRGGTEGRITSARFSPNASFGLKYAENVSNTHEARPMRFTRTNSMEIPATTGHGSGRRDRPGAKRRHPWRARSIRGNGCVPKQLCAGKRAPTTGP